MASTEERRRRRCLDVRRVQLDSKRQRLDSLKQEYSSLTSHQPPSEPESEVVVSLPLTPGRKSARKMLKDPVAATQGRKEAQILARIDEMQRQGIWTGKKITKVQLPARTKTHWDFVIEEMNWLSSVILQERKTKKLNCKKCAKMVQKHFSDKEAALVKAEKAHEANLRRIASFYAKEVGRFWGNVEKLFEFTVRTQIEQKRKQALDQHLNFIVDKTEKFSTMLAESLADNPASVRTTPNTSEAEDDNEEYEPDQNSSDDEATIAREEDTHEDGEIDDLNAEADIPVEDLLRKFHPELFDGKDNEAPVDDEASSVKSDKSSKSKPEETGRGKRKKKPQPVEDLDKKEGDSEMKALMGEDNKDFYDVVEMAAQFQPTGNTLATTTVKTPVPFLLKHTLREYQHIGLDWLVSLHERKLNGILADEMGLGKTIQTIAFLAHQACEKHIWGPHLIVVPTSVMLNWEMEIKKWAPAFKVLTYYGSQKERKLKRVGWTKPNAFHICITSYKLVTQDHASFRRKQWQYLILDEAQHIKNFKSQRWQLLLNFPSVGRLLLTGTPLQNNLMELWSLMHFLMPHVFESHRDFKEWFSNPLTGMVEGSAEYNNDLIQRLHKVLRPFLLRRLKKEVEKQMPKKYEHVVKCPLSKRQRFLYDDFMSRAKTKETLESGNLLSVINVLMQLRKVCNHPNLFEPRPTVSPFIIDSIDVEYPKMLSRALQYNPLHKIDVGYSPFAMANHEFTLTAFAAHRVNRLRVRKATVEAHILYKGAGLPVPCPMGKLRMTVKSTVNTTPALPPVADRKIPLQTIINNNLWKSNLAAAGGTLTIKTPKGLFILCPKNGTVPQSLMMRPVQPPPVTTVHMEVEPPPPKKIHVSLPRPPHQKDGKKEKVANGDALKGDNDESDDEIEHRMTNGDSHRRKKASAQAENNVPEVPPRGIFSSSLFKKSHSPSPMGSKKALSMEPPKLVQDRLVQNLLDKVCCILSTNERRCNFCPLYGQDLIESVTVPNRWAKLSGLGLKEEFNEDFGIYDLDQICPTTVAELLQKSQGFMQRFQMFVHPVVAMPKTPMPAFDSDSFLDVHSDKVRKMNMMPLLQTPETRLIQYDCGKLQALAKLLHELKAGNHRVLIFTQMTKVLDVLESFLNFHGHTYLRLDGSTKVEQRQVLMERFNANSKYFVFILSTRSGGVGINLTGADTVIFYDSDWNPTMDAQAQDRCHRIGQTRDVHIYRLISERTIEENIIKKANQKRLLGDLAIEGGNFTMAFFKKSTIKDLFDTNAHNGETEITNRITEVTDDDLDIEEASKKAKKAFESAIAAVEDKTDIEALKKASQETAADEAEFEDEVKQDDQFGTLMKSLTSIEKYALQLLEHRQKSWKESQLKAADDEIEAQRKEFDAKKLEEMTEALGTVCSTPTEGTSIASEEDGNESTDVDDGGDDSDDSDDEQDGDSATSSDEEEMEDDSTTDEEDQDQEPSSSSKNPLSPRTRSRVGVKINLWNLNNK